MLGAADAQQGGNHYSLHRSAPAGGRHAHLRLRGHVTLAIVAVKPLSRFAFAIVVHYGYIPMARRLIMLIYVIHN